MIWLQTNADDRWVLRPEVLEDHCAKDPGASCADQSRVSVGRCLLRQVGWYSQLTLTLARVLAL